MEAANDMDDSSTYVGQNEEEREREGNAATMHQNSLPSTAEEVGYENKSIHNPAVAQHARIPTSGRANCMINAIAADYAQSPCRRR